MVGIVENMTTATKPSHTLVALVLDKPGVLNRIASMFRRRGYNIHSLAVGHSEIPSLSRMTFVVEGDDTTVEQVTKQLYKLIDVVRVTELSDMDCVSREMALIKVRLHDTDPQRDNPDGRYFQGEHRGCFHRVHDH